MHPKNAVFKNQAFFIQKLPFSFNFSPQSWWLLLLLSPLPLPRRNPFSIDSHLHNRVENMSYFHRFYSRKSILRWRFLPDFRNPHLYVSLPFRHPIPFNFLSFLSSTFSSPLILFLIFLSLFSYFYRGKNNPEYSNLFTCLFHTFRWGFKEIRITTRTVQWPPWFVALGARRPMEGGGGGADY